ncbi:MAG TPA: hypothetical protein VFT99_18120, partial [Roseiflexaceae bacterium]|nr:hypothetical protein [Roseiflexaceae bacterium]
MTPITTSEHPGLQRLLEADSAQAALDAAVDMVARVFNGTAVGVLRMRAEYISSASVDKETALRSTLFMEAVRVLNEGQYGDPSANNGERQPIVCIPIHSGEYLVSVIAVTSAEPHAHLQSQVGMIQLAFAWAVQHIRRTSETRLLYEISLRFSGKNTNGQLLGDVLLLVNETFRARASRIFLVDRRTNDLAMLLSSSFAGTRQPGEYLYLNDADSQAARTPAAHRLDNFMQFLHHDGNIHLIEPLRVPMQGSIAGSVVEQGQSVIHNRTAPEELPHLALEAGMTQAKLLCV